MTYYVIAIIATTIFDGGSATRVQCASRAAHWTRAADMKMNLHQKCFVSIDFYRRIPVFRFARGARDFFI